MTGRSLAVAAALLLGMQTPAMAWMHGGGWGGDSGGGYGGGYGGDSSHASATGPNGSVSVTDSRGMVTGTASSDGTVVHAGRYGVTEEQNGAYYHSPYAADSVKSSGCNYCGGGSWTYEASDNPALAAGTVSPVDGAMPGTVGGAGSKPILTSQGPAAAAMPQATGKVLASLPAGCSYKPVNGQPLYSCPGQAVAWLAPVYGANGLYYRGVAGP